MRLWKRMSNKPNNSPIKVIKNGASVQVAWDGDVLNCDSDTVIKQIAAQMSNTVKQLGFAAPAHGQWDSSLLSVLFGAVQEAQRHNIAVDLEALPQNLQDLVHLALAVDRKPQHKENMRRGFLGAIGVSTVKIWTAVNNVLGFIGEVFISLLRFFSFRSVMRGIDFLAALDDCGPKALGIVALISFLVGLILAFVGAVQLQTFGAQIYVASLVTIGMCRIMGAIMVGIIMAGRTGSAYAATIGTMQVNEELDALETMGLSKVDFLVLPRLLALVLAMPILTMLADFMGMIGGAFVGVFLLDLPYQEYWKYAINAFNLKNFMVGIFHGFCFGFIISMCGCYCGLTCGRNADSVGVATTRSVVNAVVWMIVITGIITVICQEIGV